MFTWAFAYILVNGIGIPTWSLFITMFMDLWALNVIADGIVGRLMVALLTSKQSGLDDQKATGGYQPEKPKYDIKEACPICPRGANVITIKAEDGNGISECSTRCAHCGHLDYWAHGYFKHTRPKPPGSE